MRSPPRAISGVEGTEIFTGLRAAAQPAASPTASARVASARTQLTRGSAMSPTLHGGEREIEPEEQRVHRHTTGSLGQLVPRDRAGPRLDRVRGAARQRRSQAEPED